MSADKVRLMGCLRTSALTVAALAVSSVAFAADMPGNYLPPPAPPVPESVHLVPTTTNWYLRGDLGAHWGILNGAEADAPFVSPHDSALNQGFTATVGAGVKTQWLRTDVTLDYVSALKYQGTTVTSGDTSAKIQSDTALFNAYLDLGTWYHITPYLGIGAGAAYTRVSDYVSGGAPPFAGNADKDQWGFAWAAMAGVAFPLSHNMMLDVGYRYLNVGDVKTASDAFGAMTFKNVAGHEVRVGLRWSFDDLP